MQHPDVKIPDNENIKIWRYVDFQQCYYLFKFNKLTFASPSLFDDDLEGVLTEQFKADVISRIINGDRAAIETEFHNLFFYSDQSNIHRYFLERSYISCWHHSDDEAMSMWKLYAGVNKGVAIVTTFKKLKDTLNENFNIGVVEYVDSKSHPVSRWLPGFITKLFVKRKPYENEKEIRAVYFHPQQMPELGSAIYEHDIDPSALVDKVIISPYANAEFERSVKAIIPANVICEKSVLSLDADDPEKLSKLHNSILKLLKAYSKADCKKCSSKGYYVESDNKRVFCSQCITDSNWYKFKKSLLSEIDS